MNFFRHSKEGSKSPGLDLKQFEDPVATRISWKRLNPGGSNFKTRELVAVNQNRVEFKKTASLKRFPWMVSALPLFILITYFPSEDFTSFGEAKPIMIAVYSIPFVIISSAIYGYFKNSKPIIFDKNQGYFWTGKAQQNFQNSGVKNEGVALKNIHALQLIKKRVSRNWQSGGYYYCYELNLVLKDETRINVVDHGYLKGMLRDAHMLSDFLQVPLWNGT